MIKLIDDFLNGITMYRLMLYVLIALVAAATILSFLGVLSFNPIAILYSAIFLTAVCWITNTLFAKFFKVPTNLESVYITALILTLIVTPMLVPFDLVFFSLIAFLASASKYILVLSKKHIFNPAAVAVFLAALILKNGASWWVGNPWMFVPLIIGGLLVIRKIKKFQMVLSFLITALSIILGFSILKQDDILLVAQRTILETPIFFFCFIMLTEPQTTPPRVTLQIIYGSLVGLLFALPFRIGSFYITPEIALLTGNIFSYIVSPKGRLILRLKEKIKIAPSIYDFVFSSNGNLKFLPGQYLEWTLSHKNPDNRGVRRYFTIAASPTEENLRIGVKFYPKGSSFKNALSKMQHWDQVLASQLVGEFTLPKDPNTKLLFIAGGIGITPFRSMIKYLLEINERRDIILFYSSKTSADFVYKDMFEKAVQRLSIKVIYVTSDKGERIDTGLIQKEAPDYNDRICYISGPHSMVSAFEKTLKEMGFKSTQIKTDFFPGYV